MLQALQVSDLPARVVREASIKWTLLLLGGGLLGFLLLARPYREAWPRRFVALAGLVLLFGAALGTGLWVDPRTVDPASWCLVAGTLVLFVVAVRASDALQDPEATDTPGPAPVRPDISKTDHLLPLASATIAALHSRVSAELRDAFHAELQTWADEHGVTGPQPASVAVATLPALLEQVPRPVSLTLMADLLLQFPRDAICLAAGNWRERARVIDGLAREVITLQRHRDGSWLERLSKVTMRPGLGRVSIDDVDVMLCAHGLARTRDRDGRARYRLGPLRRAFLVNPDLAARVAERIGFAVPFSLALQAELVEIELSRSYRLQGTAHGPKPPATSASVDLCATEGDRLARLHAARGGSRASYAPKRAADLHLVGLALSGGGIRSATFNLGVLQALAALGRLKHVDYLSTVSGGGYIGSWLVLWIRRISQTSARGPDRATSFGVATVERALSPVDSPDPNMPSVRPIRFLREYSNYLTPRRGFLGADTWTAIAVWVRNTLLVQSVLVLALAGILLLPRALGQLEEWLALQPSHRTWFALAAGLLCFVGVAWHAGTELARFDQRYRSDPRTARRTDWASASKAGVRMVQVTLIVPGFLCGLFLGGALFAWARRGWFRPEWLPLEGIDPLIWSATAAGLLLLLGVAIVAFRAGYAPALLRSHSYEAMPATTPDDDTPGGESPAPTGQRRDWHQRVGGAFVLLLALLGPALLGVALMYLVGQLFAWWAVTIDGPTLSAGAGPFHVASFGAPIIIGVLALTLVLHIGLMGRDMPDERREWWSRLGAWLLIYIVVWMALFAVAVYAPLAVTRAGTWLSAMGGTAWLVSTAWGAYLAQSAKTAPASSAGAAPAQTWRDGVATLAPYVFVVGLLVLVATTNHSVTLAIEDSLAGPATIRAAPGDYWALLGSGRVGLTLLLACASLILSVVIAWRVDVNEFSMHHFYKNRLVRCYLGASREGERELRSPHAFTGFDAGDDARLATLRTDGKAVSRFTGEADDVPDEPYVGPFPILNTALNLVKGADLAWQERRAQSFVFTPIFSGYEQLSLTAAAATPDTALSRDALRPTWSYGYPEGGVQVGTAVAISGAAANPNMGYHSSPAAAFLMTMFNVRLGWWLGNPRQASTWTRSSPRLGLTYLVNELLGNTKSSSAFVNLSDGGHFENLGIYELVRRHCRLIIACDAEQDGHLTFSGLGNAIRKCRTDFGVEIECAEEQLRRIGPRRGADAGQQSADPVHWLEGVIRYPGGDEGRLIYLKSSLTGDEPGDVFEYARRVSQFPHESTADQFFDESQFESYRRLGYHIGQVVFGEAFAPATPEPESPGA